MSERRKVLELFETQQDSMEKARAGIELYRKGDATVTIVDEYGAVLSGAQVKIKQKSHEFRFGANLFMLDELETAEKNEAYKRYFAQTFNMATLPFYWNTLEPQRGNPRYAKESPKIYRRPAIDLCLAFCEQHGIEPREHALAYDHFFPDWLRGASVEEVKQAYEAHCAELATRYADKIHTIEVTNEVNWEHGTTALYEEPDFIEWCFQTTRKYFPNHELVVNEAGHYAWHTNCRTSGQYYSYIDANLQKGAPIDAIGLQYHIFSDKEKEYADTRQNYYNPKRLFAHMDLYAKLNLPLQVTEITIPAYSEEAEDEEIQAKLLEYLYTIWFSHPATEQIIYWNLVDGYAHVWGNDPEKIRLSQGDMTRGENVYYGGLLRFDLTPKPAFLKLQHLLQEVWHTERSLCSDWQGNAYFRGFFGKYEVEITSGQKTIKRQFTLSKNGTSHFTFLCPQKE